MSFLNSLIARTLSAAEVVRPRIPSLFEPVPRGGYLLPAGPLRSDADVSATETSPNAGSPDAGRSYEKEQQEAHSLEKSPEMPDKLLLKTAQPSDAGKDNSELSAPAAPGRPERKNKVEEPGKTLTRPAAPDISRDNPTTFFARSAGQLSTKKSSRRSGGSRPAFIRLTDDRGSVQVEAPLKTVKEPSRTSLSNEYPPRPLEAGHMTAVQKRSFAEEELIPADSTGRDVRQGATIPYSAAVRPLATPHIELQGGKRSRAEKEMGSAIPAPTIQVTIGRIEVRALAPLAQSRPKSKSSLTMSLDEYLRRRSGGER